MLKKQKLILYLYDPVAKSSFFKIKMDSLLKTSFPDALKPMSFCNIIPGFYRNPNFCLVSGNGKSSPSQKMRTSVTVGAKRDPKKKKADSHSFVSRPDEATGPFPEAVLLKEKKVEKDGKLVPEFADVEEEELYEALSIQLESDLNLERMRHYEVVYMIHEDHKEEVEIVNKKVQEFIQENKGRIWRFSDWGMRRLAYKIQKARNAHYILLNFELEAKLINDFKTMLDQDERVIRHLVMKRDKAETEECPPPPLFPSLQYEETEFEDGEDDDEEWIDGEEEDDDSDEVDMSAFRDSADGVIYVDESDSNIVRSKQKAEKVLQ